VHALYDHVAIAVERWEDAWPRLGVALGGRWVSHGFGPGFAPAQIEFADGMRVELIQPNDVAVNDFLRRFLDRNGPGPHHLTYKVPDLVGALREVEDAGLRPVGVDLSDPFWKEAFLHPRDAALGVVVQLAESAGEGWHTDPPEGIVPATVPPAGFVRVCHAVADLDHARGVFEGLLGGEEVAGGGDEGIRWVELTWPGSGRVRLISPEGGRGPLADWIGDRPGRVHHLAFACGTPERIEGAVALADGTWELPPDPATGTRIVLVRR